MAALLSLPDHRILALKAVMAYFMECDDREQAMQDAMQLTNRQRGLDDNGEPLPGHDPKKDPVVVAINDLNEVVMKLE